jgi:hypothetical protein
MTTPTPIIYAAKHTQAEHLRHDRMPRSTRKRSTGSTRRAALARRVRMRLHPA